MQHKTPSPTGTQNPQNHWVPVVTRTLTRLWPSPSLPWVSVCVCVLSHCSCVQLCSALWTVARQAPLSMGFSRQEHRSGLPCPPPGDLSDQDLSDQEMHQHLLHLLHWQASSLPLVPLGRPTGLSLLLCKIDFQGPFHIKILILSKVRWWMKEPFEEDGLS